MCKNPVGAGEKRRRTWLIGSRSLRGNLLASPAEETLGDHDALNLIRSLVDLRDLGIAHEALGRNIPRVGEPLPGLTDEVLCRNDTLLEDDLTGWRASHPHLVLELRHRKSRDILFDDEATDAAVTRVGIGLGEDGVEVAHARVRDPELAA